MTIIFSSVTYALKAQKTLALERIYSTITRSPAVTAVRGCGYGLRLSGGDALPKARRVLAANGIPTLGTVEEG